MSERVRRVLLQPEEGIFLEMLLGIPEEAEEAIHGTVEELVASIPGLQEIIDDGVAVAKQRMEEKGLSEYALVGRFGVPALIKGIASHKGGLEFLGERETGVVTAYLPEQKIFAVWFNKDKWITFQDWTEEKFNEHFDAFIVLPEEKEND